MFSRISKRALPLLMVVLMLVGMVIPAFAATSGTFTPIEGVTVSVSGATDTSMTDGVITTTAKGSAGLFGFGASAKTATITVYNDSTATATLSFDWTASSVNQLTIDGTVYSGTAGTFSKVMEAGTNFTATVVTAKNSTVNTFVMKNFALAQAKESSTVTFNYDSALGSVTVDGTAVANGATADIAVAGATIAATPASGSTFLAWTDAEGAILSKTASYTLKPAEDMTVKAVFINSVSAPYFYANGDTYLIQGLNEAATFAASAATKNIVLAANATLPAGDYTIPAGVTLLIPFDASHTLYTTAPGANEVTSGKSNEIPDTPYAYRQLTMANGANITVNGAVSVSAKHQSGGQYAGCPEGPCGFIDMAEGSNVTLNSGAALYAWGYIIGKGNVIAKSGANVHENFQVCDWMGGSVTSDMASDKTYGVFPMNQYYVQNIEAPITFESGAVEYGLTSVTITMIGVQTISVPYFGTDSSMFNISSGYVKRTYDGATDRTIYEANGDISVSPISMSMKLGILGSTTINTANYELPITGNMTINVTGGNLSVNQDAALLPGAVMTIAEGAYATLGAGNSIYVYDSSTWGGYASPSNLQLATVPYAYSRTYNRTAANLVDAELIINGTVDASQGYVYTTLGGANIHSTDTATALIQLGDQTTTYQKTYDATNKKAVYHAIEITNALLKNGDGTIFTPDMADTYTYANGVWSGTACRHTYELTASTDATCTAAGSKTYTCSLCGDSYTEAVAALGHTEAVDAAVAPTCTATGLTEGKHCTVCGTVTVAQTVVAATGHTEVVDAAVAPTCTATGLTEGKHCSVCGTVTVAQTVVEALGHSYDAVVTAPTCTEAGYTTYTCSVCGDTYVADETAALGHTEGEAVTENVVDATCTEAGSYDTVVYCTVCGVEVSRVTTTVAALGHSYDAVVTAPTCTAAGYTTYTCSVCGDTYVADDVAALGHTEGEAVVENNVDATCTEAGSYDSVVYCTVCGEELARETVAVDAKGHSYEVTEVYAPTCTVNGYSVYTCSVCGDSYNGDPVDAEGHPYEATVTEPTCTEGGYTTYVCGVCGDTYVADYTDALGHTEVIIEAVAPTCTEGGKSEGKYCDVCGEVIVAVEDVAALGHNYEVIDVVAPTCTVNGYTVYTCSVCGDSYNGDPVDAEGHPYEVTDVVAPTCTENGYTVYTCAVCGDSYTADPVDAEGHPYEAVVTEPTCTEGGYTTYICAVCGDFYVADETAALGHTEVTIEAIAPTCTEAGATEGKYCDVCGEVLVAVEEIAATGHSYGAWYTTVEPTAEAEGEERRDCANCDAYETNVLPKIEVDVNAPVFTTKNYSIMITKADTITAIRYAAGTYNTASEIKFAEGCVSLSASKIASFTKDGVCTLTMVDGGVYSVWVKTSEGKEYIYHADLTTMDQEVTAYGVTMTVHNLYGVKDFFIAPGDYDTYSEIKANYIVNVTAAKINGAKDYAYIVKNAGMHTVYIRYQDSGRPATIIKIMLTVDEPTFAENGLQFTVGGLKDVKVVRTAYGEYATPGDVKRAEGQRSFSGNSKVLKDKTEFIIQYRTNGLVTVAVVYNNGYEVMYYYNVQQKVPTMVQSGNTVTFGDLDGLNLIRYAEGEYKTSNEIKNAGSTVIKAAEVVDGFVTVKLDPGTYTFCVQYYDESYNYYVVTVE